jgi:hypothetical protein
MTSSWSRSVEKQTVLAVLTLNIARFSQWPDQTHLAEQDELNLCIVGNNIVQQAFLRINKKQANDKIINVIGLSRLTRLKQCHLLYLTDVSKSRLTVLLMELQGKPILTLGESEDFLKMGGMIALLQNNGKMQIMVNLPRVKQAGLVINSSLLKLSKIVTY